MIGRLAAVTRPHFTATSTAWVQRALARERFAFPAALPAPALPTPPPLTDAERANAQRWALDLSQIADPKARQAQLATVPARWQPTIRHDLAWRLGGRYGAPPGGRQNRSRLTHLRWVATGKRCAMVLLKPSGESGWFLDRRSIFISCLH